jgi:hypothetical protein
MTEKYREQYCEKHNQYYAEFLKECPICRGEKTKVALRENNPI